MTPQELLNAAYQIQQRWHDALIYSNPPAAANGYKRNPDVPDHALAVDVDAVWPHSCPDDEPDCVSCYGEYRLVAWIGDGGQIHYVPAVVGTPTEEQPK